MGWDCVLRGLIPLGKYKTLSCFWPPPALVGGVRQHLESGWELLVSAWSGGCTDSLPEGPEGERVRRGIGWWGKMVTGRGGKA